MSIRKTNLQFIQTFLAYVGTVKANLHHSTIQEVVYDLILHPNALTTVKEFFVKHDWEASLVTPDALRDAAISLGFVELPVNNFAEMLEVVEQHKNGLVTDGELICALQCTSIQINALHSQQRLPAKIFNLTSITDWDDLVKMRHDKNDPFLLTLCGTPI
jgi:hypothetical protein